MSSSSRAYKLTKLLLLLFSHVPVPHLPTSFSRSTSKSSSTSTAKLKQQQPSSSSSSSSSRNKSKRAARRRNDPVAWAAIDPGLLPERRECVRPERRQSYKRRSAAGSVYGQQQQQQNGGYGFGYGGGQGGYI